MNMRKEKRIEEKNVVVIRSAGKPKGPYANVGASAYTYDLSLGGARLFAEKPFPVGTIVRIVIELAKTCQTVQVDGEVKWVKKNEAENIYEMGVEFLHRIPQTLMSLMKNLYDESSRIPAAVDQSAGLPRTA